LFLWLGHRRDIQQHSGCVWADTKFTEFSWRHTGSNGRERNSSDWIVFWRTRRGFPCTADYCVAPHSGQLCIGFGLPQQKDETFTHLCVSYLYLISKKIKKPIQQHKHMMKLVLCKMGISSQPLLWPVLFCFAEHLWIRTRTYLHQGFNYNYCVSVWTSIKPLCQQQRHCQTVNKTQTRRTRLLSRWASCLEPATYWTQNNHEHCHLQTQTKDISVFDCLPITTIIFDIVLGRRSCVGGNIDSVWLRLRYSICEMIRRLHSI